MEPVLEVGSVSLRARLVLVVMLTLIGALACGSVLVYWHAVAKVDTEMKAALAVGHRVALNAVDDAEEVSNPRRRLELMVADFDGDRHLRATLLEPSGNLVKSSRLAPPVERAPGWLFRFLGGKSEGVTLKLPPVFEGHGTVVLLADPQNEIAEVWTDFKLYFAILAAFCAVVLALLYLILGRALRPLDDLTRAFAQVGEGNYRPRIELSGSRELIELGGGFNRMVAQLAGMQMRNRRLTEQLEQVQEEERVELARNLHDEVSPLLFSIDVDATAIRQLADTSGQRRIAGHASSIKDHIALLKKNVKAILGQLRPSGVPELELKGAIANLIAFWKERHPEVEFRADIAEQSWGASHDSVVHAIVRESVSNALKHGSPRRIGVQVGEDRGALAVTIEDDGGGMAEMRDGTGFGIRGMRERVAKLSGTLDVMDRREGRRGVIVAARIPLAAEADEVRHASRPEAPAA